MSMPLPATGRPADIAALLTPDGTLGPNELLAVDSAQGPGQQATPQTALAAAGDGSSTDQQVEMNWSQANPSGQASTAREQAIDLWNFDVARTELKQEHILALTAFVRLRTLSAPGIITAVATGYASSTGQGRANSRLADQRAQAVADWCDQNGLPGVIVNNGGIPPGNDGESFARARSVHLEIAQPPPLPPPPSPRYRLLPGTKSGPLVAVQCGMKNIIEVDLFNPVTFFELPPNGYLQGDFSFTLKIRFTFKDPQACLSVQESINASKSSGSIKITKQVADALALRFSASGQWDKDATVALTALVGEDPWEVGLQSGENYLVVKSPNFPLTELAGWGPNVVTFTWDGAEGSVQIMGQLQFAGRPGSLLIEPIEKWGAGLEISAAEAAALVGALATCAAVFYLTIDAAVNGEANAQRFGGLVAQRMGFAAQLAMVITDGATEQDASFFLAGYDDQRLRELRNIVDQSRRDASDQLEALGDQRATIIDALHTKYTKETSGNPPKYNDIANSLADALGGVSGVSTSTGDPPSLNQLLP